MKTYIELWKAKSSWKNLSIEERGNFMGQRACHSTTPGEWG